MGSLTGALRRGAVYAAFASITLLAVLPIVSPPPASAATVPATVTASNWTVAPNVSGPDLRQSGVSCVTSTFCMAVGTVDPNNPSTYAAAAQVWNGSNWTSVPVQEPANPSILYAVSCVNASWCVAVGESDPTNSTNVGLIEQWNGSQFSIVPVTSPSDQDYLDGVSCLNASFCFAVGASTNASSLFAQWNGTSWSFTTMGVSPGLSVPNLTSVSCGAMNNCMAVGYVNNFSISGQSPLAYNWDGSSWSGTLTINQPAPINDNIFQSVSCVGPWFCAAAGYDYNSNGAGFPAEVPLVELWNKPSWSTTTLPPVPDVGLGLDGISCFSATSCTAVGSNNLDAHADTYDTAALTWDGQTWAVASTPNSSANPNTTYFNAVDCVTNWACMGVGASYNGSGDTAFAAWAPIARSGYRFVATDGGIFNYGPGAPFLGSNGSMPWPFPIVGMATMPAGDGYYLVSSDGGIFAFGSAKNYGTTVGLQPLNKPIVGMAVTADGGGYWLVASDGGVFAFGDAQFFGSTGAIKLNKPIVGMAATPNGLGYYLVASDGGIFTYGNASFAGSMGGQPLNKPVVGMAAPVAGGYYLVASDGGIFSFPTGAAGPPFFGSTGAIALNKPVIGMTTTAGGRGYYLGAADGGIFSFPEGPAGPTFYGSRGGQPLNAPIVGISG